MKIYLSGPNPAEQGFDFFKFEEAEISLKKLGHQVINPAKMDNGKITYDWLYYILRNLHHLQLCGVVYMLEDWDLSLNAQIEYAVAKCLDLYVLEVECQETSDN